MTKQFVEQKALMLRERVEKLRREAENHRANADDADMAAEKATIALEQWEEMLATIENETSATKPSTRAEAALAVSDVKLAQAFQEAALILGVFTKVDIAEVIRERHPQLEFAPKSLDKPLHALIANDQVTKIRESVGQNPSVYKVVR